MAAVGQEYVSASRARGEGWEQGGKGSPRSFSVATSVQNHYDYFIFRSARSHEVRHKDLRKGPK